MLHLTEAPYCASLLKPRHRWLRRFSFPNLFHELGEAKVDCVALDYLAETEGLSADIMKLDTQGLEVPILRSTSRLLQDVVVWSQKRVS